MHKVINVIPLQEYKLLAEFENEQKRIYDVKPLLEKAVFAPLKSINLFNRVYIEYGAVTWKDYNGNEVDICSDKLYMDSKPLRGVI